MKSMLQTNFNQCFLCKKCVPTEEHHIFNGPKRKKSTKWNMTVRLCRQCHEDVHKYQKKDVELKAKAEKIFEETYSRELYKQEFGKYYIDEEGNIIENAYEKVYSKSN